MSQNTFDKNVNKDDISEMIEGYKVVLLTPYGKLQSLPSDLYSSGRSIKFIE